MALGLLGWTSLVLLPRSSFGVPDKLTLSDERMKASELCLLNLIHLSLASRKVFTM